jgi:aryl-alcohol dehydrogenase-like predicted oxidoreductase
VAPIASLQSEYSLFERSLESGVLDACEEFGIGLLAYAPLGRGMLTGRLRGRDDLLEHDSRRTWPRFFEENIDRNLELVGRLEAFAADKGVTAGQLALAWLLARRPWIVPIPGTKRVAYLEENAAAAEVELTPADLALLDEAIPAKAVAGERYPPERMPTWTSAPRR